jgi:hypothetical protein
MTFHVVTISALTVATLTLVLAAQVLVMRSLLIVRTRRRDRFLRHWEPLLYEAVESDCPPSLPRVASGDLFTFLTLWNYLQDSVIDDASRRLNDVAHRLGMVEISRRMLRRRGLRHRLMAIATLGHLRDRSVWNTLCACAASPQVVLSLAAARALVQVDREAAVRHLMPSIVTRSDWPAARVASLLRTAGPGVVSRPLVQAALEAGPKEAPRLIGLLDAAYQEAATPAIQQLLERTDEKETIAASLRALRDPQGLDSVRRFSTDPRWEIRVQAAAAIGRLGNAGDAHRLSMMLSDREWWVRFRAAKALCSILKDSPAELDELQRQHDDPFARDALTQARAEGAVQ